MTVVNLNSPVDDAPNEDQISATGPRRENRRTLPLLFGRAITISDSESSNSGSSGTEEDGSEEEGEEMMSVPRNDRGDDVQGGNVLEEGVGEEVQEEESYNGGCSSSGNGLLENEVDPPLSILRDYSKFSTEVTTVRSIYNTSTDLTDRTALCLGKSARRGCWEVEGMARSEHAAIWPSSMKFVLYDTLITEMHIRPPFSSFAQNVISFLNVSPSQLHPNGWAFMRAFELICKWMKRTVSPNLFLNLFEVQRMQGKKAPGWAHLSLRSVRNSKLFQIYSESLKSNNWKTRYYWVKPLDEEAVSKVGRYNEDGSAVVRTQFHLGWSLRNYNSDPGCYRTPLSGLDDEDRETRRILFACAEAVPVTANGKPGFHTTSLVQASTKSRVLAAISRVV